MKIQVPKKNEFKELRPKLEFLKSLVIIFGISSIVIFALNKLRIPSVVGFLIAGVFLGPHGLELIKDIHLVEIFAEIGVVLLLFTIGLEFSLNKLLTLRRTIFLGGFLQVFITSLAVFLLALLLGQEINTSLILGFLIALSSTAIVLKMLLDRAEIDSPHGRTSMGILIFQDLFVVLFILLIPILAGTHRELSQILWVLAKSFGIIIAVIISARWLVPKALHQIVHTRIRELFVISIIFACLGTAFLTYKLGLSLALGAFIAGLIISESEYSYQAISDILPFRDSFNGLFFVSVGMLMNIHFFLSNVITILLIVGIIIILKTLTSSAATFITGSNLRVSLHSGLILSQIGEFSFVISVVALRAGLISDNIYQFFLSSAVLTMLLTPVFVNFSPEVSTWITSRRLLARLQTMRTHAGIKKEQDKKTDHVIIVGFGLNGRHLSLVLKELEVSYVILELNSQTVTKMRETGEPIVYGDGTRQEILHKLGIEHARVVVIAISDPSATRKIITIVRKLNPKIFIVVSTRYLVEVEDLIALGADEVIPAEFETSIELFSRVLHFYHMPKTLIGQYSEKFRKDHYRMFFRGETPKRLFQDTVAVMPDVDHDSFFIESGSPAVNSSLKELDIHNRTGALVIAVKRGSKIVSGPATDFVFHEGDIIFLIADKASLETTDRLFFKSTGLKKRLP
jgi:CPA2 family monovalent cation:H+ antiporter-2